MNALINFKRMALVAALAAGVAMPALADDPGLTDTEITIGMFAPLSGPLVGFGLDPLQAGKMLYEEVNKKGGIHGRKIKVVSEDDKCQPNELVAAVKKLVSVDKVFLLHGGSCSGAVAAGVDFINREKVPHLMITAGGDSVIFPPTRYVFGAFVGSRRAISSALGDFAVKSLKVKRVAIIAQDDDSGKAEVATLEALFKRGGVEIVAVERFAANITDVTAPMLKIRSTKPDAIISGIYPGPAILVAQKSAELGMTSIALLQASQGIPTPSIFATNVGNPEALKNFYYPYALTDVANPATRDKYVAMYKAYYPAREPATFMTSGLPTAMTVIAALEAAGPKLTREGFVEALEKMQLKTEVLGGSIAFAKDRRDAVRDQFIIKFDGKTQTVMPGIYSWNGKDGN